VYVVFKDDQSNFEGARCGPGVAKGHVIAIDHQGYLLNWFSGANHFYGKLFNVPGEPTQCIDYIHCRIAQKKEEDVDVLYVVPISPDFTPALLIACNRSGQIGPDWGWNVKQEGGETEIQIGPRTEQKGESITSVVSYQWSRDEHRYIGPNGAPDQHFMRLSSVSEDDIRLFYDHGTRANGASK